MKGLHQFLLEADGLKDGASKTPYEVGYQSFKDGVSVRNNPYSRPKKRQQWLDGWLAAQQEAEGSK